MVASVGDEVLHVVVVVVVGKELSVWIGEVAS